MFRKAIFFWGLAIGCCTFPGPDGTASACGKEGHKPVVSWQAVTGEVTFDKRTSVRQQLFIDGVPVYGWQRRVFTSENGKTVTPDSALPVLSGYQEFTDRKLIVFPEFPQNWVAVSQPVLYLVAEGSKMKLVYVTTGHYRDDIRNMQLVSDANTGKQQTLNFTICAVDSTGSANTMYHGIKSLITEYGTNGLFTLEDKTRGKGIVTLNLNYQTGYSGVTGYSDADNHWNNGEPNPAQHAVDAHYGAAAFYDYLMLEFGRNSLDNQGMKLTSYMNYGNNFVNAFWNGNAVVYGGGNSTFGPMTTLDIAGHEFAHGLIQEIAGLQHQGEPGIIQESLADIFGTALEWHEGTTTPDWTIGEDNGNPVRSMSDPGLFNHPDTYLGDNWYYGTGDNGGVHINCGFINKWFYLLSEGGSGINDHGASYSVQGIGIQNAVKIVYDVLLARLVPQSGFIDFMNYTIQESETRYGNCSSEMKAVVDAWKAVGLYTEPMSALAVSTPLPHCEGTAVELEVKGAVYSDYQWTMNGAPITLSMTGNSVQVTLPGSYQVTENRCGTVFTSVPVEIEFSPVPVIETSKFYTCAGVPVQLTSMPAGGQFNVSNPYYGPTSVYEYTFVNSFGCSATGRDSVIVHPVPEIQFLISATALYKDSDPLELHASVSGTWMGSGVHSSKFYPSMAGPGVHTVQFGTITAQGCEARKDLHITVLDQCRPFSDEIQLVGGEGVLRKGSTVQLAIDYLPADYTVKWVLPLEYVTINMNGSAVTFQAAESSLPVVAVINNLCGDSLRFEKRIQIQQTRSFSFYPNPAVNEITLIAEGVNGDQYIYEITDIYGNVVASGSGDSESKTIIATNSLATGIYFVGIPGSGLMPEKLMIVSK